MPTPPDSPRPRPLVLIVRDGWGQNPHPEHSDFNAIELADTPRSDALMQQYPSTLLHTSGEDVGLPLDTMGNSEVGHQNLGGGRVVDQESVRITKAIRNGEFFDNHVLCDALENAGRHGHAVHIMGICSDAGVHGLLDHLYACVELCKRRNIDRVYLHMFTDGRDTGPFTGEQFLQDVQEKLDEIGTGRIASVIGRYYAMDRDNRWERVARGYACLTGRGLDTYNVATAPTPADAVQSYYDHPANDSQTGDEFIPPIAIGDSQSINESRISDGDTVIFYNYRGDRPREITRAFVQPTFEGNVTPSPDTGHKGFDRGDMLNLTYICMTQYDEAFNDFPNVKVAYPKQGKMTDILGDYLSQKGLTQFRCAETEKFPHVTFFFNDYREDPFEGETREMAQSPKVATYDLQPEMSAHPIRDLVLQRIRGEAEGGTPDVIIVNFANGDMVGHTGKLDAAVNAVETVDACVGEIVDATLAAGGALIVTADHGNAEQMFDPQTGSPHTAHTLYDVPCILVSDSLDTSTKLRKDARLADIAPTMLDLLGLKKPEAMTGQSLLDVA